MRVLELFAGSRSIGKAAEQLNMEVFSTDIEPFQNIHLAKDIFDLRLDDIPFVPDIIWASPPCTGFSVASCWKYWRKINGKSVLVTETARLGIGMVKKTLRLIKHYQKLNPNLVWYIENPRGKLRKQKFMSKLPLRHTVTYCQYGDFRMKPTDIWTNNPKWIPQPMCHPKAKCHESATRSSRGGTERLKNSYERSKIPDELCVEVLKAVRK